MRSSASPTSEVGSIGTVMMHVDRSHELEKRGRRVTLIHAGAHKVDGNQFEPLSPAVRADLQRTVDEFNNRFIDVVAAGRGRKLSPQTIRDFEAGVFMGQAARGVNLVDRIGSFSETLQRLKGASAKGAFNMTQSYNNQTSSERTYSQAELDAVVSQARDTTRAERDQAVTAAHREGEQTAMLRVVGILRHEHAEGRIEQAHSLALDTSMSVEEAGRLLATFPKADTVSLVPPLNERAPAAVYGSAGEIGGKVSKEQIACSWERALKRSGATLR